MSVSTLRLGRPGRWRIMPTGEPRMAVGVRGRGEGERGTAGEDCEGLRHSGGSGARATWVAGCSVQLCDEPCTIRLRSTALPYHVQLRSHGGIGQPRGGNRAARTPVRPVARGTPQSQAGLSARARDVDRRLRVARSCKALFLQRIKALTGHEYERVVRASSRPSLCRLHRTITTCDRHRRAGNPRAKVPNPHALLLPHQLPLGLILPSENPADCARWR